MTAPRELHEALDRVYDGQQVTVHGDHLHHAMPDQPTIQATVDALVRIPEQDVPASKGAIADLVAIMQGIADRAEQDWQAERARRN